MSMVASTLSPEQIAVVNAGSSSIKFALFASDEQLMSAIRIWVIPTDEECIIARHAAALVRGHAERLAGT